MTVIGKIGFLAAVLSLPFSAQATDNEYSRRSLRGVKTFSVLVESLGQSAQDLGLTVGQLQTAVELKLRLAGIEIVSDDVGTATGSPYLYVSVLAVGKAPGIISYSIRLDFNQIASLQRDPKIRVTSASTWDIGMVASIGKYLLHAPSLG